MVEKSINLNAFNGSMDKVGPRLKEFIITLVNSIKELETEKIQTDQNTILNLWPTKTLEEILSDPLFYEKPITQPSLLTLDQYFNSLQDKKVSPEIIKSLSLVNVDYRGFDNNIFHGQVVIRNDLVSSIREVFKRILTETDFPLTSVFPISMFNWNSSSKLNNSSVFDWRLVSNILNNYEISDHSVGAAIDINPVLNPWMCKGLENSPNFPYNPDKKGTLYKDSDVVKIFKEAGWKWGGDWENSKDWMHFYRPEIMFKYYGKVEVME